MSRNKIQDMLKTIEAECSYTGGLTGRYAIEQCVIEAMAQVDRKLFVPDELKSYAYDNSPLPIGRGQTISQPFIVALMTDLLAPQPDHIVLEVGAGSGYQAAILARLVKQVYSLEIIPQLAEQAARRLKKIKINNVEIINSDGSNGWPQHAPYDGIIATAAAPHIPPSLVEQLSTCGRLVIPIGHSHMPQQLVLLEKDEKGRLHQQNILSVAFVPFVGNVQVENSKKVTFKK
jgi:protein-L-isoaspartate(D-aspartate) O-methyltransferase